MDGVTFRDVIKDTAVFVTQLLGVKAVPLRLIQREFSVKTIYGALGQKMRCFCFGRWSITVWRIHEAETKDPRFCTEANK
jgi:hypothetical protein